MVELLIKLNQLADSKVKQYSTNCNSPICEEDTDGIDIDSFSDNERRYRTAGI